jgi:hypothetical protein
MTTKASTYNVTSNVIGELIVRKNTNIKASMLDSNNILWKLVNDKWVGKRSVWTVKNSACWLEDAMLENIKSWWCGLGEDYNEEFYRPSLVCIVV